ncbi:MAG: glycerate kinase [Salinirussus sp.]
MISDRDRLARSDSHAAALSCLEAGISAADPERVITTSVTRDGDVLMIDGDRYDLAAYDRVILVGGGKAGGPIARALEDILGDWLDGGIVVTDAPTETDHVEVIVGDHPIPSQQSVVGGESVLQTVEEADEHTLVIATVSGGGSALLAAPADGLTIEDLRSVTETLIESGASIDEINAVRKHCSALKGGRLARAAAPATVASLTLSDVIGDDLETIASGPLAPDSSTYEDAQAVLERYEIDPPEAIREHLAAGVANERSETPDSSDPAFETVVNYVLANARTALEAAADAAREHEYEAHVLSSRIRGEAREAALMHMAVAEEMAATGDPFTPPAILLSGGETTVSVRGDGIGGPNHEFALAAALELDRDGIVVAAVDTDGRDGTANAAGAIIDNATVDDQSAGLAALANNDAGQYLADRAATLETGGTGTNVNDLRVVVVDTD